MRYIITAIVASLVLFATSGTASAQHRGGGHSRGGHSVGHSGGYFGGGHYRAGHSSGFSAPSRHVPIYSRPYSFGGYYPGSSLGLYGGSIYGPRVDIHWGPGYSSSYGYDRHASPRGHGRHH